MKNLKNQKVSIHISYLAGMTLAASEDSLGMPNKVLQRNHNEETYRIG